MLGAVLGDIIGSYYEWNNVKTKDFPLVTTGTRYTDDTVMTLAVAKWLMEDYSHSVAGLVQCMQKIGRVHIRAGYGGRFIQWLMSSSPHPYNSWGNGSAMRVSPVGLFAESESEARKLARITASVTHNHPEGIKGAEAVALAVYVNKKATKSSLETRKSMTKKCVKEQFGYDLDRTLNDIRPTYKFDVSCQGSVPEAIIAYLESKSIEDCVRNAISIGGDSDTIAAIACSIFMAGENSWKEDNAWTNEFEKYLSTDLRLIMTEFENKVFKEDIEVYNLHSSKEIKANKDEGSVGKYNLQRFLDAQSHYYEQALREVQDGLKRSHWIWFIFPQLAILGHSYNAKYYGISGYDEAEAYLKHPVLGERLRTITKALLVHTNMDVVDIFGGLDAMKVCSCMTLFDAVSPNDVFQEVLDKFYKGQYDLKTLNYM